MVFQCGCSKVKADAEAPIAERGRRDASTPKLRVLIPPPKAVVMAQFQVQAAHELHKACA